MLDNPPLLTIHRGFRRPDKALIEAFRGAQTSHLADAMDGAADPQNSAAFIKHD
jgi:4-hydroxy-4-methyl-2-oxoglutarate aldolase